MTFAKASLKKTQALVRFVSTLSTFSNSQELIEWIDGLVDGWVGRWMDEWTEKERTRAKGRQR